MKSASEIERLARTMRIKPNPAIDDRILARAGEILEKSKRGKSTLTEPNIRRMIVKKVE